MSSTKGSPQQPPWPRYKSDHIVRAAKVVRFETNANGAKAFAIVDPGDGHEQPFNSTIPDMLAKVEIGDYAILYDDNFMTFIAARQFEAGYSKVDG